MANVCAHASVTAAGISNGKSTVGSSYASGLPEQFVMSMRTLFKILDKDNVGLVPLSEIEDCWRDEAVPNLPGVLDALRSIAPADEMLSLETFVWGLKMALARASKSGHTKRILSTKLKPLENCKYTSSKVACPKINHCDHVCSAGDGKDVARRSAKQIPDQRFCHDEVFHHSIESRPSRRKHIRSISGPVFETEVLTNSNWKCKFRDKNSSKFTQMGYATKFSAPPRNNKTSYEDQSADRHLELNVCDKLEKIKLDLSAVSATPVKDLKDSPTFGHNQSPEIMNVDDNLTTAGSRHQRNSLQKDDNTLYLNQDYGQITNEMKPIDLRGKFIGVTGSVQTIRSSSHQTNCYGSLKRPAMSTPFRCSAPYSDFQITSVYDRSRCHDKTRKEKHANATEKCDETQVAKMSSDPKRHISSRDRTTLPFPVETGSPDSIYSPSSSNKSAEADALNFSSFSNTPCCTKSLEKHAKNAIKGRSNGNESQGSTSSSSTSSRQLTTPPPSARQSGKVLGMPNLLEDCQQENVHQHPHYASLQRKKNRFDKRREQRRHTVANGVNYNMLRCIKLLNDEKKLLRQGVKILNWGQTLLKDRLENVERQGSALSSLDQTNDCPDLLAFGVTDEHLESLSAKIHEMTKLVEEFALTKAPQNGWSTKASSKIKDEESQAKQQNSTLTKEVSMQASKIFQLEREKSLLIQQLFHAKAELQISKSNNSSIFI